MKKRFTPYKQGFFKPLNPQKYKGNPIQIVYRSSWELKFMMMLDKNPDVLQWGSEELTIRYRNPLTRRSHRYFPDFYLKKKDKDGNIREALIEIKPHSQTMEPKTQKQRTPAYIKKCQEYVKNKAKWEAATSFCQDRKWEFHILTEHDLGIK